MYTVFVKLLNMSLAAGALVLVIVLLRLFLKKAPRKYVCILWALVALRLICPVSKSSSLSVFNLLNAETGTNGQIEYFQYNERPEKPELEFAVPALVHDNTSPDRMEVGTHTSDLYLPTVISIWLFGAGIMLIGAFVSYIKLRKDVAASILRKGNIYICDEVKSPFILGIIHPHIYLPSGMDELVQKNVIVHETAHIQRRDYWWKPLGYLLLSFYWFNPLIWLAYILFCRDIEVACDEKAIENMDKENIADYTEALVACAVQRRMITSCPVAFGETDVKGRVKNILNYKKPAFWIAPVSVVICIVMAVCFLTNPKNNNQPEKTLELYTEYIGDAPTVSAIAQNLPYPEGYSYASIELQTEQEPYELKVYLNGEGEVTETSFEECADLAYASIGNLGMLTFLSNDTKRILTTFEMMEGDALAAFGGVDTADLKYYLTIGDDGVYSIDISVPGESGGCEHADGTPFKKGERVWLETLDGCSDLRGVDIAALDKDGTVIWSSSVPDVPDNKEVARLKNADWDLTNAAYGSSAVSK